MDGVLSGSFFRTNAYFCGQFGATRAMERLRKNYIRLLKATFFHESGHLKK
jgi:hypothetical protein